MLLAIPVGLGVNAIDAAETAARASPIEPGRAIYQQACASCHGDSGGGAAQWQEVDANGELPAPPHDSSGHTWKHSDSMLYRLVQQGWRDPFNKTRRLTMPAFQGQLSRQETMAVIDYLKTLWTPEQRRFQAEESLQQPFPTQSQ